MANTETMTIDDARNVFQLAKDEDLAEIDIALLREAGDTCVRAVDRLSSELEQMRAIAARPEPEDGLASR